MFPDDSHAASCHGEGLRAEVSPHSSWKGKAGLDDEDGDGCSVVTSATAGGKFREIVQDLPLVDNEQSKGLSCKGCGCQASDKNAWTRYSPVYEGSEIVGKKPKGSVCKICTVTFQTSGLDAMHSSIGAFFKHGATAAGRAPLPAAVRTGRRRENSPYCCRRDSLTAFGWRHEPFLASAGSPAW